MIRARDDGSTEKPATATIENALHGAQEHLAAVGHWASPSPVQTDRLDAEPLAAWETDGGRVAPASSPRRSR